MKGSLDGKSTSRRGREREKSAEEEEKEISNAKIEDISSHKRQKKQQKRRRRKRGERVFFSFLCVCSLPVEERTQLRSRDRSVQLVPLACHERLKVSASGPRQEAREEEEEEETG